MGSTIDFRQEFVVRLNEACDGNVNVPPAHQGRQKWIRLQMKAQHDVDLAPEAVSKWFRAESMPRPDTLVKLAMLLGVEESWLAYGVPPDMDRSERRSFAKEMDGAVFYVMGLAILAGWNCGFPSDRTPKIPADFFATMRGSTVAFHISLGRPKGESAFEVLLPKDFEQVHCVALIPLGKGKYEVLDLTTELINQFKGRKEGSVTLEIERVDGRFVTQGAPWPRIKDFAEFR